MDFNSKYFTILPVICVFLFGFGVVFNWFTAWLHQQGYSDGYTWGLVVIGVVVTLLASGFVIGWTFVLVLFVLFACSGLPMALGNVWRYVQAKREFVHYRSDHANEETPRMGK